MERTLIILKPSTIERGLIGEIIGRFERKGLSFAGLKMMQLSDAILNEHYAHLREKPFFQIVKSAMQASPVIVGCLEGNDVVKVVRNMCGPTNGRDAQAGTIRGDFSMSVLRNIIHTTDLKENAPKEIARFFKPEELFIYKPIHLPFIYADDEIG